MMLVPLFSEEVHELLTIGRTDEYKDRPCTENLHGRTLKASLKLSGHEMDHLDKK